MTKTKKVLSVMMAALMLVFTCMTYVPASAAEVTANAPEVAFVGIDHSPLVVGDTESFSFTTNNADKVQYSVVINDAAGKLVEDVTKGYAAETAGNVPFELKATTVFAAGKYSLVVNAKRVSDGKIATYTAALNCVSKDDANRVYANGAMVTDKDSYVIGDKITVTGINGLAGIPGPYKYRLHVFNATTGTWTKNVVANYGDKIEWTPSAPGTYVLDVHVNTEKSTTWAKYAANPTSTDVYGTYEAWKLKTVVVSDKVAVTKVASPSKNTVVVTFNQNIGSVVPSNFTVAEKADEYSLFTISSVSVKNNVATLKLAEDLDDATAYTVTAKNVTSLDGKLTLDSSKTDFTYVQVETPVSVAFTATKLGVGDEVADNIVVKDKDGNDITENFTDVTYETSNTAFVDATGTAIAEGYAIVNVVVSYGEDNTIETGNTLIQVVPTLYKLSSIGKYTLAKTAPADFDTVKTSLFKSDKNVDITPVYSLFYQVFDQDGSDYTDYNVVSYRSLNPTIAQVDENGGVTPFAAGTATIVVKLEDANDTDITVSKAFTVTVKADPKATSLKLNATSFKLDKDAEAGIDSTLSVTVLDQYGNEYVDNAEAVHINPSKTDVVNTLVHDTGIDLTDAADPADADGVYSYAMHAGSAAATSTTLTITYGTLKASATATTVSGGTDVVGYIVTADYSKVDKYVRVEDDDANFFGPLTAQISVYGKNAAGNKITDVTATATYTATNDDVVAVDATGAVTYVGDGTDTVSVVVGSTTVAKLTFTAKDTTPVPTKLVQKKEVISVTAGGSIFDQLFGWDGTKYTSSSAFVAYDQFGNQIEVTPLMVQAMTSNTAVIDTDLTATLPAEATTVTVTLLVNEEYVEVITAKVAGL